MLYQERPRPMGAAIPGEGQVAGGPVHGTIGANGRISRTFGTQPPPHLPHNVRHLAPCT